MSATSAPELTALLRATPRGQLRYERRAPPPPSLRAEALTPTSLLRSARPQAQAGLDWTSVLEEVTRDMERAQHEAVARLTRDLSQLLSLNGRHDDLEVTLGPAQMPRRAREVEDAVAIEAPSPPAISPRLSPAAADRPDRSPMAPWTVTSPEDRRLQAWELGRQRTKSLAVEQKRLEVRDTLAALHQKSCDQYEARLIDLVSDARHRAAEMARVQAADEARRLASQKSLDEERRQQADQRRRQLELDQRAEAQRSQAFQAFKGECQKWVGLIIQAEQAYRESAERDQAPGRDLAAFFTRQREDLPQLKAYLQTGTAPGDAVLAAARHDHVHLQRLLADFLAHQTAEAARLEAERCQQAQVAEAQEVARQAQAEAQKAAQVATAIVHPPAAPPAPLAPSLPPLTEAGPRSAPISAQSQAKLVQLTAFKSQWLKNIQPLMDSEAEKAFRFACQKAVNTPVNAVNANSSAHLKDKLDKLQTLLRGDTLEVTGKPFNAASHPLGVAFCKYILAQKVVDQGSDVVSSKPDAVFGIAQVLVALWAEFGDFGSLTLASLFETNPNLVPYHRQKQESETPESYYQSLGYRREADGAMEQQDLYVKRMAGVTRLYAAITVTHLPKAQLGQVHHPHGLGQTWCWIVSELNLSPVNDLTATMLQVVLEVTTCKLSEMYGKLFQKLILTIARQYVPLIKKATLEGSGGPVDRLETTLTKIMTSGSLEKPQGMLNPGFI
eukprot:snap_masked-scaffold494_size155699-processed-gene-0.13 protein:Tk10274 transcript:snap_masked-scaffold494_size155699-processed-gene-0.13-mRNA-1 annotation:"nucleoporin gle1"